MNARPLLVAAFLFLLFSCSGSRNLRLRGVNFGQVVELSQNLVFQFSRDVVREPSASWQQAELVRFTPAVPGRFKWISASELMFSPAVGFRPSTAYKARMTDALAKLAGQSVDEKIEVEFHTPWLQIAQADAWWTEGDRPGNVEARCRFSFNYRVTPAEVQQKLKVNIGDQAAGFVLASVEDDRHFELRLVTGGAAVKGGAELALSVAPGLRCAGSDRPSAEPLTYSLLLPDPNRFETVRVETEHSGVEGVIKVHTSHTPNAAALPLAVAVVIPQYWGDDAAFTDYRIVPQPYGFELRGSFDLDGRYRLILSTALQAFNGLALEESDQHDVQFGVVGQSIAFASNQGMYLTRTGNRYVGVRIHNVSQIYVKITKIYENNLLHFMRQNQGYSYDYDSERSSGSFFNLSEYYDAAHFGDLIYEKEHLVEDLGQDNGQRLLKIDFDDLRKNHRGAFVVEVGSKEHYYVRANKMLVVTDLGLAYDQGSQSGVAFVHRLTDAKPLSGAEVSLVSSNNQTMAVSKSDGQGSAPFSLSDKTEPQFKPALLVAKTADDFCFLSLDYGKVEISRYDVGGKTTAGRSYDAWIYGPRYIYRPGETLAFNALVRAFKGETPALMPVEFRLTDPEGRVTRRINAKLNPQGAAAQTIELALSAPTGNYNLELYSGAEELLASRSLLVEEFVPDRIRVDLKTSAESYSWNEAVSLNLQADYFFGPPASFRNYEIDFQVKRKTFSAKGFEAYDFSLRDEVNISDLQKQGQLDAQGQAIEALPLSPAWQDAGLLAGRIFATVFDENGRPVHRFREVDVRTQNIFYGVGRFDRYVDGGSPMKIPLCAVDAQGRPANNVYARVRVIRYDYESTLERIDGQSRYKSRRRAKAVLDRVAPFAGGRAEIDFTPTASGEYEVQVSRPGSKSYVMREFFAYGWGSTSSSSFGVNTEGSIDLVSDKSEYQVGDEAKILFKTPFDGRLIVRIEQGEVITHQQLETRERAAQLRLNLRDGHVPTVYVAATLIRPMTGGPLPLTVARGYLPLQVSQPENRLPVKITAVDESRSLRRQTITVQTEPDAELTLAAVDEGILQLQDTQTPDAYAWLYGRRALEVAGHDMYGFLLPELGRTLAQFKSASTGGDMAYEMGRRNNPFAVKGVKPVAFWSGPLRANAQGVVKWQIDLPQFSGTLRIMAVAYKGRRMGGAERAMKVSDPLVISAALPRFLTPGDTLSLPVTLFNNLKQNVSAQATVRCKGPLKLLGGGQQSAQLPAQGESRLLFSVAAGPGVGAAEVEVSVQSGGDTYRLSTEVSVRPAAPLQKRTGSGAIADGRTAEFRVEGGDFVAGTGRGRVVISALPVTELGRSISELLAYPHGCAEQTISTAFPQLYLTELSAKLRPPKDARPTDGPTAHVRAALAKLASLQLSDGGIEMWPGVDVSHPWTSAYAAHFMLEAQRADYEIDAAALERLLDFLRQVAAKRPFTNTVDYFNVSRTTRRDALYALYVITLAGRKETPLLNHYREQAAQLAIDERYLLACAFGLTGNRSAMSELLPSRFEGADYPRDAVQTFSSPLRDRALALAALLEADPSNPQIGELAKQVSSRLKAAQHATTQELAFSLTALGRMARKARRENARADIYVGGKKAADFKGQDLSLTENVLGQAVRVSAKGGTLYYYWESEGVSRSGDYVAEDRNLMVRKTLMSRAGAPVGPVVTQGDLLVMRVSVSTVNNEPLHHVVLTDLLPAGFEAENPRISETPEFAWTTGGAHARHVDYRDDRVHFFADLAGGVGAQHFYYVVRAVSPGRFRMGPVSGEAMYDAGYRSAADAGVIRVEPRAVGGGVAAQNP